MRRMRVTKCSVYSGELIARCQTWSTLSNIFGDQLCVPVRDCRSSTTKLKGIPYFSIFLSGQGSALPVNLASNSSVPDQPSPSVNLASNFGAPSQTRQQLRRSQSTSPVTSALPVNLASNFGAHGQPRQQLGRSWSTSPATSALPIKPRQQLWRSRSNLASNCGAPGQPSRTNILKARLVTGVWRHVKQNDDVVCAIEAPGCLLFCLQGHRFLTAVKSQYT